MAFDNYGGNRFTLAPGATRGIFLCLHSGLDFYAQEIEAYDSTIEVVTDADGISIVRY